MERARDTHLDLDRRALVDHVSWLELLLEPFDLLRLRVAVQKRRVRRHDGLGRDASSPKSPIRFFGVRGRQTRNGWRKWFIRESTKLRAGWEEASRLYPGDILEALLRVVPAQLRQGAHLVG